MLSNTYGHDIYVDKLEAVQHRFFRYAAYKVSNPINFDDHNYTPIAKSLNI